MEEESLVDCGVMVGEEGTATWGTRLGHDGGTMHGHERLPYFRVWSSGYHNTCEKMLVQGDTGGYRRLPCPTIPEAPPLSQR